MSLIRTLVVDDEPLAREGIAHLLRTEKQIKLIGTCGSGKEALKVLEREEVDLLFLDIQIPGMTGFDLLARLPKDKVPVVVFVTAFDEFALKAFKVHALDYLLKPYTDQEFFDVLDRAKRLLKLSSLEPLAAKMAALLAEEAVTREEEPAPEGTKGGGYMSRIAVTNRGKITPVSVEEIDWIEAADDYVHLHRGAASHLVRETLARLEAKLDPSQFVRIHRSIIVRIGEIRELKTGFGGSLVVVLKDGKELGVGRTYRQEIRRVMHFPT
jgi:two-component system LytT family response regulator